MPTPGGADATQEVGIGSRLTASSAQGGGASGRPAQTKAMTNVDQAVVEASFQMESIAAGTQAAAAAKEAGTLLDKMKAPAIHNKGNGFPQLSARARGWLRHIHKKATTADDVS